MLLPVVLVGVLVGGRRRPEDLKGYTRTLEGPAGARGPMGPGGDDDEEEEPDFAEEQLRKAVRRNQAAMPGAAGEGAAGPGAAASAASASHHHAMGGALGRSRMEAIQGAGQAAIAALREGVARLQASHNAVKVRRGQGVVGRTFPGAGAAGAAEEAGRAERRRRRALAAD